MADKQQQDNQKQVQTDDKAKKNEQENGQQGGKYDQNSYSEIVEVMNSLP